MTNQLVPIRRLKCSCCGEQTQGRQWHDQDVGWGLCPDCIPLILKNCSEEELQSMYGERGVHFDLPNTTERDEPVDSGLLLDK